jgi:hypothetical protein
MAQTTGAMSFANAKIEVSTDGTAWTDISGFANKVQVGGGERSSAEYYTADGDTPIFTTGKRGSFDITVSAAYTEGAAEPAEIFRNAYENSTQVWLRWSPKGGGSGSNMYTGGPGVVLTPVYPQGDASSADVIALDFTIKTLNIEKSTVA